MTGSDTLVLPANLDSLGIIRKFALEAAAAAGMDENASYNLQLAVDEIATNVIVHGYQEANLTGEIRVYKEQTDKRLRIIIEDTGVPFDPRTLELPDEKELSRPIEERSVGGLGIYLAFKGVDRFDYERVDNRNRNIFEVFLK